MDKYYYEESVLPLLRGREGYYETCSSTYEFKQHLKQDALEEGGLYSGWVFWSMQHLDQYTSPKIKHLLKEIANWILLSDFGNYYLIQFWAAVKVEGGHHYLSTSNQPFLVGLLAKGLSWYRNVCIDHVYDVDVEGAGTEQIGGVGRSYRNKQPESTPDLRLYSINEFPLRDHAARCGFRFYLALPLFHVHNQNQCCGVLEFLSPYSAPEIFRPFSVFYGTLETAGLWSTHTCNKNKPQVESEIIETLQVVIKAVPRLSLAQVWVPCKECNNSSCMERAYFVSNVLDNIEMSKYVQEMRDYVDACQLHNLQLDVNRDLCDDSICKNPLTHYAQKARLSLGFAIWVQSENNTSNHSYVIGFFLQPKYGEDSSMQLLFTIIQKKLKSFKFVLGGQLLEEFIIPNPIELEYIDMLKPMDSYMEIFLESDFTKYLETVESCCLRPYYGEDREDSNEDNEDTEDGFGGWVFSTAIEEVLHERVLIKEKIKHFMKGIAINFGETYCMVQFWAPTVIENRRCLRSWDQPYALGCLAKGLASFRKECIKHHYLVDEEANEDELGPIGRVFRNGHPELLYDLVSYSTKEFFMKTYALHCGIERYFTLPVFDEFNKQECVGVLEFVGFECEYSGMVIHNLVRIALEAAKLRSSHFQSHTTSTEPSVHSCNIEAMDEIKNALYLISKIPQCHTVNVWVPNGKCMSSNPRRMEWLNLINEEYLPPSDLIRVEPKMGVIGLILESESKSCFCQNMGELSIAQQPLVCFGRKLRSSACFAICLQSSHTGDLLYVLEFFLYQYLATYEYLMNFLNFLLPVLKHQLKSFKLASGKQLGEEELVVEVIEFSQPRQFNFSASDQLDVLPIKFKSVMYGKKEHQHIQEQDMQSSSEIGRIQKEHQHIEEQLQANSKTGQGKHNNSNRTDKGKRKHGLRLEDLKSHCDKTLEEAAKDLGVSRSTIKRSCREHGINRWSNLRKQARNSPFFEREMSKSHHQDTLPRLQDISKDKKDSLIIVDDDIEQNIDDIDILQGETIALTTRLIGNHTENANASLPIPMSNVCNNVGVSMLPNKGPPERNVQKVRCYALLPEALKMLCICFKHLSDGRGISIALDDDVFCNKCNIYIHLEDFIPFCNLEPISGNCMVIYIWHLYNKMKDGNTIRRFQFVNPFAISYVPNSQSDRHADALVDRFNSTSPNQILLAPCNVGEHWILTIIQPYKEIVMLLDSIAHYDYESWKSVVNMAISKFNDNLGKKGKEQPTWETIKAPRQPDHKQCGYYVMRYMKEIVEGLETIDSSSLSSLFVKEEYSQTEINDVRSEWGLRVQKHVPNTIY